VQYHNTRLAIVDGALSERGYFLFSDDSMLRCNPMLGSQSLNTCCKGLSEFEKLSLPA
jgi:hypothetical protein